MIGQEAAGSFFRRYVSSHWVHVITTRKWDVVPRKTKAARARTVRKEQTSSSSSAQRKNKVLQPDDWPTHTACPHQYSPITHGGGSMWWGGCVIVLLTTCPPKGLTSIVHTPWYLKQSLLQFYPQAIQISSFISYNLNLWGIFLWHFAVDKMCASRIH